MHTRWFTIVALLLLSSTALAGKHDAEKAEKKAKKAEKKAKAEEKGKLTWGGRIFGREALTSADGGPYVANGSIKNARLEAAYAWRDIARAKVSVELSGGAKLKTTYVKLKVVDGDRARSDVRAGYFKLPFSTVQLTSSWELPVAGRGVIDNVLVGGLQVAGRHYGATFEEKLHGAPKLALTAGVFQGTTHFGDPLAASASDGYGQDLVLRATIEPAKKMIFGASFLERAGAAPDTITDVRHRWSASADATIERGGARLWAEGYAGSSWLGDDGTSADTVFAGGRAIVAWRTGGAEHGSCFVEPYAMFGMIDPDSGFGGDLVTEAAAGVGYGNWDVWRVQLEGELSRFGTNAPPLIQGGTTTNQDANTILVQVGLHL